MDDVERDEAIAELIRLRDEWHAYVKAALKADTRKTSYSKRWKPCRVVGMR